MRAEGMSLSAAARVIGSSKPNPLALHTDNTIVVTGLAVFASGMLLLLGNILQRAIDA